MEAVASMNNTVGVTHLNFKRIGFNDVLLNFFADYLDSRDSVVILDGCSSDPCLLSLGAMLKHGLPRGNVGTVLGGHVL